MVALQLRRGLLPELLIPIRDPAPDVACYVVVVGVVGVVES